MRALDDLSVSEKGTYVLQFRLDTRQPVSVGRFGEFTFEPGRYYYVGSAQRGLRGRLRRHLHGGRNHWHLDYLLPHGVVEAAYVHVSPERWECRIAQSLAQTLASPVRGFGSSDCRCASHLLYAAMGQTLPHLEDWRFERLRLPLPKAVGVSFHPGDRAEDA